MKIKEELNLKLKEREEHISHLLSEIDQHQTICSDLANELQTLQTGMEQVSGPKRKISEHIALTFLKLVSPNQNTKSITIYSNFLANRLNIIELFFAVEIKTNFKLFLR